MENMQDKIRQIEDVFTNPRKYKIETFLRDLASEWNSELTQGRRELEKLGRLCKSQAVDVKQIKEEESRRWEEAIQYAKDAGFF